MSEKTIAVVESTKRHFWKWLGALLTTEKVAPDGTKHMAVSLTKLQKLVSIGMAVALFTVMVGLWIAKPEMTAEGIASDPIPASMLHTLWALLGLSGVNMVSGAVFQKTNGS